MPKTAIAEGPISKFADMEEYQQAYYCKGEQTLNFGTTVIKFTVKNGYVRTIEKERLGTTTRNVTRLDEDKDGSAEYVSVETKDRHTFSKTATRFYPDGQQWTYEQGIDTGNSREVTQSMEVFSRYGQISNRTEFRKFRTDSGSDIITRLDRLNNSRNIEISKSGQVVMTVSQKLDGSMFEKFYYLNNYLYLIEEDTDGNMIADGFVSIKYDHNRKIKSEVHRQGSISGPIDYMFIHTDRYINEFQRDSKGSLIKVK